MKNIILALALVLGANAQALEVKGFNLSQLGSHVYDANPNGPKTEAQDAVDYMYSLGARHVILIPVARMESQTSSSVVPETPVGIERSRERQRYLRLITYIKSKGMTVGIRPILLVNNGGNKDVWHGNIRPENPSEWFESFRAYLDIYTNIAKAGKVDEFTVGAELYSMSVGTEDLWPEQPFGFPHEWTVLIRDIREKLGPNVRIAYDMNYTDVAANSDGTGASGGEFERWRYRLADLKPKANAKRDKNMIAWEQMRDFWNEIDVIGIDMYRNLMSKGSKIPGNYNQLVAKLRERAEQYASDIDNKLQDIESAVGKPKKVIFKELGFKSCTGCFVDPFDYDDSTRERNVTHQAAAYQAIFDALVKPNWPWLSGISFWDVAVDPARSGPNDPGFSPRGKALTEDVIRKGWGN